MAAPVIKGTLVRVEFTGKVRLSNGGGYEPPVAGVVPVSAASGNHFLDLNSTFITGSKSRGGEVTIAFDGIVTGKVGTIGTRAVQEVLADGSRGLTHYIYLGRDAAFERAEKPGERTVTVALTRSDVKTGDKVSIAPFEAEVIENRVVDADVCVKVRDDDGNISFIYINRLTLLAPYEDGAIYFSNGNAFYRYVASKTPGANGTWQQLKPATGGKFTDDTGATSRSMDYDYPGRPLVKVTLGEPVSE